MTKTAKLTIGDVIRYWVVQKLVLRKKYEYERMHEIMPIKLASGVLGSNEDLILPFVDLSNSNLS